MSADAAGETPGPPALDAARENPPPSEAAEAIRLVVLVPGKPGESEPPISDADAVAIHAVVGAPWHPAILNRLRALPRVEPLERPSDPQRGQICVTPAGLGQRLVSGFMTQAADAGVSIIDAEPDRWATVSSLLARLGADPPAPDDAADPLVRDFLALGTVCWMFGRLAVAMSHDDCLDCTALAREVLGGARAWTDGDHAGARNRLRAAFECLTQAREKFYPVDDYLLDLVLLEPTAAPSCLSSLLDARVPFTLMATGEAIEKLATNDPSGLATLREAVTEGWADIIGGPYREVDEPLRPVESILWQYRRGAESYRAHLESRSVETLARRRFGPYPMLPQIARRFGMRYGFSFCLDEGKFPLPPHAKRVWEAPDGSSLETLTRPPVAADQAIEGVRIPARIARSMKEDHVATIPIAHWPDRIAGWFDDLHRAAAYSPVFGRWTTAADYFHLSDRPWDTLRPGVDDYESPYLAQSLARRDDRPISRRVPHASLRGQFDSLVWTDAIVRTLDRLAVPAHASEAPPPTQTEDWRLLESPFAELEEAIEHDPDESIQSKVRDAQDQRLDQLATRLRGNGTPGHAGYLILNPLGWSRRCAVVLPEAPLNLPWQGALRAAQLTDEGVSAVIDLPAHGFVWIDAESQATEVHGIGGPVRIEGTNYVNGTIEVEVDPATGGLRGVRRAGEPSPRLAQQLMICGLVGPDGTAAATRMIGEGHEIEYAGPALAQGVSRGRIVRADAPSETLARFEQRVKLWHGRGEFELEIRLQDVADPPLHADAIDLRGPWDNGVACRWAWADGDAELRRSSFLALEKTSGTNLETAESIEIASRGQRTLILVDGLAFHRKHGNRMLDSLLIPRGERERAFRLRVSLDADGSAAAVMDASQPPLVVRTVAGRPASGDSGWFFRLDHRGIAVTRAQFVEYCNDGRGWGLVFHLLETANRATRTRLRLFRDPIAARLTDFQGDHIVDLEVAGDAVHIDLTPRELARVEIMLGEHPVG